MVAAGGNPNGGPTTGYLIVNPRILETPPPSNIPTFVRGPRTTGNAYVRAIGAPGDPDNDADVARANARSVFADRSAAQIDEWALNGTQATLFGTLEVQGGATAECQALGYDRAAKVKWWYLDEDGDGTPNLQFTGDLQAGAQYRYAMFRTVVYTAHCRGRQ